MSSKMDEELEHASGDDDYDVGDRIGGKYQLLRKAGEGAMGAVWVAANTALEVNVAIKVLRPEMRSPAIAERLLREARAAAKLSHPAIVRIFDLGETACGAPYIVMELLEGEALRDLLCRDGRLLPEAAVAILLPVASAMHAAHDRGIIHRDLKPDNVMLAQRGDGRLQPKVVDFGIAKVTWTEHGPGSTGAAVIGTPHYMPPEQALGHGRVDHRADIWAFCTMLYEAIAGETPYASEKGFGALRAVVQDPVPALVERCGTDPALWAIIERGLRKDPRERWSSMRELGAALATWLLSRGVSEDVCGASLRTQWLEEPIGQVPSPSPRTMVVTAPTLPSARAPDVPRRSSVPPARKVEESGARAWSEAMATGDVWRGAPAQPLWKRLSVTHLAAIGFVAASGAVVWTVAGVAVPKEAAVTQVVSPTPHEAQPGEAPAQAAEAPARLGEAPGLPAEAPAQAGEVPPPAQAAATPAQPGEVPPAQAAEKPRASIAAVGPLSAGLVRRGALPPGMPGEAARASGAAAPHAAEKPPVTASAPPAPARPEDAGAPAAGSASLAQAPSAGAPGAAETEACSGSEAEGEGKRCAAPADASTSSPEVYEDASAGDGDGAALPHASQDDRAPPAEKAPPAEGAPPPGAAP